MHPTIRTVQRSDDTSDSDEGIDADIDIENINYATSDTDLSDQYSI